MIIRRRSSPSQTFTYSLPNAIRRLPTLMIIPLRSSNAVSVP